MSVTDDLQALLDINRAQTAALNRNDIDGFLEMEMERDRLLGLLPEQLPIGDREIVEQLALAGAELAAAVQTAQRTIGNELARLAAQRRHREAYGLRGRSGGGYSVIG
jgi:hypothetical protein